MLISKREAVRPLILVVLLEAAAFLGGAAPVAGAAVFALWEVLASPTLGVTRKVILVSLPFLGVSSLLWTSPIGGQLFIGIVLFLFLWVHNDLSLGLSYTEYIRGFTRKRAAAISPSISAPSFSPPDAETRGKIGRWTATSEWREVGIFLYLFILAVNFFVVRAEIFSFLGLPLFIAITLVFFAVYEHQKTMLPALIFTLLFTEVLAVSAFLASSYIVLSVIMVVLYALSSDLLRRSQEGRLIPKQVIIRVGTLSLLIFLLLVSSGLRPR